METLHKTDKKRWNALRNTVTCMSLSKCIKNVTKFKLTTTNIMVYFKIKLQGRYQMYHLTSMLEGL